MTVINSNIAALKAQANLAQNARKLDSAMERLSSGTRINSAKDDAAGLAISTKMTSQINGLNQAIRNANDGLSMVSTIEASLAQTTNVLQRMRELAVQSASDSNSVSDRQFLQAEIVQMNSELDRIASQSRYNGLKVLDGSFTNKQLQIGANSNETIAFNISAADSASLGIFESKQNLLEAATADTAAPTSAVVSDQVLTISGSLGTADTSTLGSASTAFDYAAAINNQTANTGVSATAVTKAMIGTYSDDGSTFSVKLKGKNTDAVTVSGTINLASDLTAMADAFNLVSSQTGVIAQLSSNKNQILLSNSDGYDIVLSDFDSSVSGGTVSVTSMAFDATADDSVTGSNATGATPTAATLTDAGSDSTRIYGTLDITSSKAFTIYAKTGGSSGASFVPSTSQSGDLTKMSTITVATQVGASNAINVIDGAIAKISSMRGDLGAIASRLEKTVDALTASSTNTSAARSRILDADYSSETTSLSKAQIIAQASNAMLAQANQQPQLVLALLK